MSSSIQSKKIKKNIMRRVYAIWFLRRITKPFVIESILFFLFIFWLTAYISFGDVWGNSRQLIFSPLAISNYMISAFLSTETLSKVLLIGLLTLISLFIKDLTRIMPRFIGPRRNPIPLKVR